MSAATAAWTWIYSEKCKTWGGGSGAIYCWYQLLHTNNNWGADWNMSVWTNHSTFNTHSFIHLPTINNMIVEGRRQLQSKYYKYKYTGTKQNNSIAFYIMFVYVSRITYLHIFGEVEGICGPPEVCRDGGLHLLGGQGLGVTGGGGGGGRDGGGRQLEDPPHLVPLGLHRARHWPEGKLKT